MDETGQGQELTRRCATVATAVIVAVAVILRIGAFSPFEISHADELMQYLEQGNRLATGHGVVPWEYRFGARNGLIAQLLAGPLWLGHALAPGTLAAVYAARASFAALCTLSLFAAWRLGALAGRGPAIMALFVAAVWWESVLFSELLLSESLATMLLLLAAAPLLKPDSFPRATLLAGLLLGLAVVIRLQYAGFAGVLALAALRFDGRRWGWLIAGGLLALVIGAASDLAMGRVPFGWIAVNYAYNIAEGRAARFGAEGPWWYLNQLMLHLGPAWPLILGLALLSGSRYRPLLFAALVNLLLHSLIAHKEYRFIWATTASLLVLAGIASARMAAELGRRRNLSALAAVLLACLLWLGLSLWAEATSGGGRAMRGGSAIPRLAIAAASDPAICGIAVADQYRAHVVPALLPRDVPLSIMPKGVMAGAAPLPGGLAVGANALILDHRPDGAEAYQLRSCNPMPRGRACLFVRPGRCNPSPRWSYQAALERETL